MKRRKPKLSFNSEEGATLSWSGGPALQGGAAMIKYRSGERVSHLRLLAPDVIGAEEGLEAVWRWQPDGKGYRLWVELTNTGSEPLLLDLVEVLTASVSGVCDSPADLCFYQNGWQSWSPTFARHGEESLYTDPGTSVYQIAHQPHAFGGDDEFSSEWVTLLSDYGASSETSAALLAGFVTTKDQLSELRLQTDTLILSARCHLDGAELAPGSSLRSEVLALQAGPEPLTLLEEWADATGVEMQARVPGDPPTGWCTWYYFYGENSADDVLENVEAISGHDLPLDVILIDDGYQTAIGDWLSVDGHKFPQGMAEFARQVRESGHRLGIWTAPFGAAKDSELYAQHPDWFLHDAAGDPVLGWVHWGTECYALDCTNPAAVEWVRETFAHMRDEWGVDFFKIDFIFAAARPGLRHDPAATRAQALRRGIQTIREAIGDEAFLLGCGAPLGPCVGVVDGMRVGPDVDPNWKPIWRHDLSAPSTESALRNSIARAPLHGRLWANDPDCVLVRQRSDDLDLVLNEMRTLVALTALLGGITINSDHLPAIRPGRLKYLRQALPPTGVSARPLDLFENELPRLHLLPCEKEWGKWWVVGLVNWDDSTIKTEVSLKDLGLPAGRYHVYNYWRRRYLGTTEDKVTIRRHQPHETVVLLLKPVSERPDLLTTTFHVCQGLVEIAGVDARQGEAEMTLALELAKAGQQFGEVLFAVPDGWLALEAQVDGNRRPLVPVVQGIVALGLTLQDRAEVEIRFVETNAL